MATSDAPLNVPNVTLAVARGASSGGGVVTGSEPAGNIFSHDFEDASYDASVTAEGAGWDRLASTTISIVRDDQYVVANDSGPKNPPTGPITGRQWESSPISGAGSHANRFRYGAGNQGQSELRFKLGTFEEPDVWLRWDLRVPINHLHEAVGGGSDNNKLVRLFHSAYESGGKVGMEFRADGDGSGSSVFYPTSDSGGNAASGPSAASRSFARVPEDRGRWMRIIFHSICETSPGASDGIIEVWRRWEDESAYTKEFDVTGLPLQRGDGTVAGFNHGYLMGYANSGYASDTEWLLDNFNISTETLL